MLRKIACNATNSGAIDAEGNVYVWGAGKYGLLGNPKQKNPVAKPIMLQLKFEKLILDYSSEKTFVATCISFGQYHAAVVVNQYRAQNDGNINSDFNPLLYAENILKEFKAFLMKTWDQTVKKLPEHQGDVYSSDQHIIEHTLKYLFKDQVFTFPFITVTSFKELMVYQAKMSFKDTVSYNRLFQDLSDPNDEDRINLKELRDQLIGRRCGNGVVFTWGIVNDGRLGVQLTPEEIQMLEQRNQELVAYKPVIVKFDENVIITKISCGNSFTLALSQEGLGNSGGLGQGETNVSMTPYKLQYQKNGHAFHNIKDIACGASHCLALDQQGAVYSWGNGQGGRLGHGDETGENTPKEILTLREQKIVLIEAGEGNSAAITIKNELYIWGVGLHGRLGTGKTANVLKPMLIEDLKDQKVEDICLGSSHTLCILRNGKAMCWGSSKNGKIGLEATLDRNFSQPKELVTLEKEKIFQFAAGPFHSLALTEQGDIFSFGNAKDGKLGYEENNPNVYIPRKITGGPKFQKKSGVSEKGDKYPLFKQYDDNGVVISQHQNLGGCEVVHVSTGFNYTIFLLNDGTMYNCGSNKYGQLGLSRKNMIMGGNGQGQGKSSAQGQGQGKNAGNKNNGNQGGLGATTGGGAGGGNDEEDPDDDGNQLNDQGADDILPQQLRRKLAELEQYQDIEKPTQLIVMHGKLKKNLNVIDAMQMKIRYVSCGYFHVVACTHEGQTFGWGRNDYGQLGMGRKDNAVSQPNKIKSLSDKKIVMTQELSLYPHRACGENFTLFLSDLGEVLCSGFNEFGELGIGLSASAGEENKDLDLLYDETYQKQLIETKIELTPKVIKGLESIVFIAVGKNHSVAIRTYKRKEKELRLFTWGCGWYGQTGHGSWHNDYSPKIVKVPVLKDTKFIQASCGSKHTIALDTTGQVWFFGHKLSVGIEDFNNEKQLVPVRLEIPSRIQDPIKYISSGEEHNLAVTYSGSVYGFGRNTFNKINASSKEYVYFEGLDSTEKARLTSCGANHSVLINTVGVPYTWGSIANGRCGLKLENDDAMQQKSLISLENSYKNQRFMKPTVIYSMKMMFQKEMIKIKEILGEQSKSNKDQFNALVLQNVEEIDKKLQIKFPIQRTIKEQFHSLDEENLINQDRNIQNAFNRMIEEFNQIINEQDTKLMNSVYTAQNAMISRIYSFPSKIDYLTDVKAELPMAIIRNKQIYETIFTFLQVHPCYLINWITKTTVNRQPKEVISILKMVFGEKEMRNDLRILHILMTIARKIFHFEMETYDLKEILLGRSDSTFSQLFNLIFENQDQNNMFINKLLSSILHKLQKFFSQMLQEDNRFHTLVSRPSLQYQFDYESVIQDNRKAEQRIRFLIEFMKICFKKMLKALDPKFKNIQSTNNPGKGKASSKIPATISNEIISLVYVIKEDICAKKSNDIQQEDVDSYLLIHVFEILIRKLHEMNFEVIKDFYWDLMPIKDDCNNTVDKDVFNFSEKRNLLSVLADHLEKYLRKIKIQYNNPPVEVLNEFLVNNKQNYRRELSELLNFQPYNFDYLLAKDLFINSMDIKNATLSISINDLIFIYNNLVEKGEIIFIPNHLEDPINILINELGNAVIEVKQNEKQFISEEILEYKINLEIRQRLLLTQKMFTRCSDCNAPVYEDLIPPRRFKEGFYGKPWVCIGTECRTRNDQNQMTCFNCKRYREALTIPKDQMFQKYRQVVSDPTISVFQLILYYMPIIDIHQSLDEVIEYEVAVEESRKNPDYDKLTVIEQFKKYKDSYMFLNKKKNVNFEDAHAERAAEKEVETEFLNNLEMRLIENYQNIKQHEKRIAEYYQFMKEVRDKISNYLQQQIQYNDEYKQIIDNIYTGLGSDFLKGEKQDIFAGKLHLKQTKKAIKLPGGNKAKGQSVNPQLENFFKQLEKQASTNNAILMSNYQELIQNKEMYMENFAFFGKYPLYQLRQRKVLHNIQIHGKKLQTVMKKCSYVFYDDNDNGFRVELVYEEQDRKCLLFGMTSHEAILETFKIPKDTVAEMRRTMCTKATIQFGNSEFNVFELVFLLNEIKSKTYTYAVGSNNPDKKVIKGFGQGKEAGLALVDGGTPGNVDENKKNKKVQIKDNKI